ncbi:hypothetical protein LOZ66_001534 [Ophidiomyces ophidiicola]|nr:hypothetical protein LOZ66_001534 [Ophidiomyces ophidiicola]
MYFNIIAPVLALAASVCALQVTSPKASATWNLSKKHSIEWNAVSTDPLTFAIELVNMSVHPPFSMKLARGIKSNAGSYITEPIRGVPPGSAYQFNLVSDNPASPGILAQSQQFTVVQHTISIDSESSASGVVSEPLFQSNSSESPDVSITSFPTGTISRTSRTFSTPTSTRRSSTSAAFATPTTAKVPQRTSNAAPAIEAFGFANSLIFALLALIA